MRMNQRCMVVPSVVTCMFIAAGITGCSTSSSRQEMVLEELKGIRSSLDQLNESFSKEAERREKLQALSGGRSVNDRKGADVETLLEIKLPANPTQEDVKSYISKIKAATEG